MQNEDCRLFKHFVLLLLQIREIASWYQLHTSFPSRSTLHICQKFQWTSKQLKSAYLDLQYFYRMSAKFPAEHLSLLLEWFTPFFWHHNSFFTVFWVSSFFLSVNIMVLYQFMVTCMKNFASKVEAWGLSDGKRFIDDVLEKKGMDFNESRC